MKASATQRINKCATHLQNQPGIHFIAGQASLGRQAVQTFVLSFVIYSFQTKDTLPANNLHSHNLAICTSRQFCENIALLQCLREPLHSCCIEGLNGICCVISTTTSFFGSSSTYLSHGILPAVKAVQSRVEGNDFPSDSSFRYHRDLQIAEINPRFEYIYLILFLLDASKSLNVSGRHMPYRE